MERMSMRKKSESLLTALTVLCCLLALFMGYAAAEDESTSGEQVQASTLGQLDAPQITAPELLNPGEDMVFTVEDVEHADNYGIDIWDCTADESVWDAQTPGEFTIDSALLTPGHIYNINVNAWATGYEGSFSQVTVIVLSDEPHDDNITIELGNDDEIFTNENFTVRIKAPGATFVRLYQVNDPNWVNDIWVDDGDYTDYAWPWASVGQDDTHFFARASYDEHGEDFDPNELTYGNWSNILTVRPTCLGEGAPADVSAPETIAWGEFLPIEISVSSDTINVDIHIFDADEDSEEYGQDVRVASYDGYDPSEPLLIHEPTANLKPAHRYGFYVLTRGFGQEWFGSEEHFFEVEPNNDPQPRCIVTPERQMICEGFEFIVTVPGSEGIYLHWSRVEDGYWEREDSYEWFGSGIRGCEDFPECGTFRAQVMATFDAGENWEEVFSFDVEIYAKGQLDKPEIEMPEIIPAGEDLIVNIGVVENAEEYVFGVIDAETRETIVEDGIVAVGQQIVPAELLLPGHVYEVGAYVMAYGIGYNPCWNGKTVFVTDQAPDAAEISTEKTDILINENVDITIDAPGASFVRIYARRDYGEERFWDIWPDGGYEGRVESIDGLDQPGTYYIYARACYDDIGEDFNPDELNYGPMSNILVVYPVSNGQAEPVLLIVPETVARGELLRVDITPQNSDSHFISLVVEDGEDNWVDVAAFPGPKTTEPFTVYLPTIGVEPGQHIRVQVWTTAAGLEGDGTWADATVTEGEPETIFMVTPEEAMLGGYCQVVLSAPGATDARITSIGTNSDPWTDEYWGCNGNVCTVHQFRDISAGNAEYIAEVSYDGGESWTELEHVYVNVMSKGMLDYVELDMPNIIGPDEDFVYTISAVENATEYRVVLRDNNNGDDILRDQLIQPGRNVVPASKLTPGHTYTLDVAPNGDLNGYESDWTSSNFFVCDTPNENFIISVENPDSIPTDYVEYTINAPGATFVRLYEVLNTGNWIDVPPEGGYENRKFQWSIWNSGTRYIFAKACYEPLEEGQHPDDLNYTAMSNVVEIHQAEYDGAGTVADFSMPDTVVRGDFIPVDITLKNGDDCFAIFLFTYEEGYEGWIGVVREYRVDAADMHQHVLVPTANLTPGDFYYLEVWTSQVGKEWTRTPQEKGHFTVTEPQENAVYFTVENTEAAVGEKVVTIISAPGSENAVVGAYSRNGEKIRDFKTFWKDERGYIECTFQQPGIYSLYAEVSYPDGSSKCEGPVTVLIGMDGLTTLNLPAMLTRIEDEAFLGASAQKIVVPAGVMSIGSCAFANCHELMIVEFTGDVETIAADAFDGCGSLIFQCKAGSYAESFAASHGIGVIAK